MLQLYLQYLEQNTGVPILKDNSCEIYGKAISETDSISAKSLEIEDLPDPNNMKKQYSNNSQQPEGFQYDLNFDITWDDVCCNLLKDFSYLLQDQQRSTSILPTRMVLGIALPESFSIKSYLDTLRHYFKRIQYIRVFRDHDFIMKDHRLVPQYKQQSLIVVVFHHEDDATTFLKEMNCQLISKEHSEYLYLLPISKMIFLPFKRTPSFEIDETPLDVAQQLALLGQGDLTPIPKCPICLEKIEGFLSGVDFSNLQEDLQQIYSNPNRWVLQKQFCKVCQTIQESPQQQVIQKNVCSICQEDQDVWVCMICGNLGCGRYKFAHAQGHYLQTNHIFSLELLTGRVWDYNTDNFVHRLMHSGDKSILLPDSSSQPNVNQNEQKPQQERVEKVILEYCYLMTRQMEDQRKYYEDKIQQQKSFIETNSIFKELENRKNDLVNSIQTEKQNQISLKSKLEEIQKGKRTLKPKIDKMQEDISQQQVFNSYMKEKIIHLNSTTEEKKSDLETQQLFENEKTKLQQLQAHIQRLYLELEQS